MSNGYISPILPLGIGVIGETGIGSGYGPLPFLVGVETVGPVGVYGGGGTYDRIIERKLDRDEDFDDLMNMYINIVASGILE